MKGKIIFLTTDLAYGGAETQVVQLAIRLKERGWKVLVVSLIPPQAYVEELEKVGIPVFSLGIHQKMPDPRPVLRLFKLARGWRPHIVHSHMVHANILARIVRPLVRVPLLVCTAHSIDERGRRGSGRLRVFLYRLTVPFCDLTTQVSQAGYERYVRIGAVPKHKIRYIPNGVDTRVFCPDPIARDRFRKELGLTKDFVWLAVGRFEPPKDYPTLIKGFFEVAKINPGVKLLIVGDGPLRPFIEKLTQDMSLNEKIRFLGTRRDINQLMNAADAYVMSSEWEGMPMVLLEASACGLPIVATNVGGNGEIVLDGQTGFLVPPKSPKALAQAMLRMMDIPEEVREKMGKQAREHIEKNFNLDHIVDYWEALYYELLDRSRGVDQIQGVPKSLDANSEDDFDQLL